MFKRDQFCSNWISFCNGVWVRAEERARMDTNGPILCRIVCRGCRWVSLRPGRPRGYGLKLLNGICPILTKKITICRKRKARDTWATHKVTRNAHQLYTLSSFNSTQKIRFVRPNSDLTFIQTSHSLKGNGSGHSLSWPICRKRSPRSVLTIVRRERLFTWWWKKRGFDSGRFLRAKRVLRSRWGVFAL